MLSREGIFSLVVFSMWKTTYFPHRKYRFSKFQKTTKERNF